MTRLLLTVILPAVVIGVATSLIAKQFGFDIYKWQHWEIFAMMMVPYVIGRIIGFMESPR